MEGEKMKRALITGISGQDGSYLAEFLLAKGYEVHGIVRRSAIEDPEHRMSRIKHILPQIRIHAGSIESFASIFNVVGGVKPDECYHLAAQSFVAYSFEDEFSTLMTNINGTHHMLSAMKQLVPDCRFYLAASSEMFGKVLNTPQNESTPFNPQSPYGLSKMCAFYMAKIYRTGFGVFASNGILFNHESPRRGLNFVTRKITIGLARIKLGLQPILRLGNLNAVRDWGYSKDYVEAIWRILQHKTPDDFVIATGETHTVREFVEEVTRFHGMEIVWQGEGLEEKGIDKKTNKIIIEIDPIFFRPNEVDLLKGDASKAKNELGWSPATKFSTLARLMAESDLKLAEDELKLGKTVVSARRFAI